eukprot:6204118-Pleurochrysis_carterae.AAC.1
MDVKWTRQVRNERGFAQCVVPTPSQEGEGSKNTILGTPSRRNLKGISAPCQRDLEAISARSRPTSLSTRSARRTSPGPSQS